MCEAATLCDCVGPGRGCFDCRFQFVQSRRVGSGTLYSNGCGGACGASGSVGVAGLGLGAGLAVVLSLGRGSGACGQLALASGGAIAIAVVVTAYAGTVSSLTRSSG
mgnify:CR=1 FL=1